MLLTIYKKSLDSNCAIIFSAFFLLHLKLCEYGTVHQNLFWTATSVMRAATHFKMLYGYCNRTHLSIIKRHMQKAPIVQLQFA